MSDFNSSLPIRTEANGDIVSRISDGTITSQLLTVNADGSLNITDNGASLTVDATDLDIRNLSASQDSVAISDGTDSLAINADGSINATVSATNLDIRDLAFATDKVDVSGSSVTVSSTNLDIRDLVFATDKVDVSGSSVTVSATNLDIRDLSAATDSVSSRLQDGAGTAITSTTTGAKQSLDVSLKDGAGLALGTSVSPLVVSVSSDPVGDEINDYSTASAVAASATSNHTYTVTAAKTLKLTQIEASSSGKMKIEVQVETGVATNTYTTKFVQFNSTAAPNMNVELSAPISVAAGVRVRIIRTNRDNNPQDLYSTISGIEV